MQQLHHFRGNTCRHGAELSTCLCVSVCKSEGLHIHSVSDLWEHTHIITHYHILSHTHSTPFPNQWPDMYKISYMHHDILHMQWCWHFSRLSVYGGSDENFSSFWLLCYILTCFIPCSPLRSLLAPFALFAPRWGILRFHDNHSVGGNGLDTRHCPGGVVAVCVWVLYTVGGGEGCLWGVWLVKRDWGYDGVLFFCVCVCVGESVEAGFGGETMPPNHIAPDGSAWSLKNTHIVLSYPMNGNQCNSVTCFYGLCLFHLLDLWLVT